MWLVVVAEILQAGRVADVPKTASPLLRRCFLSFLLTGLVFFRDLMEPPVFFRIGGAVASRQSGTFAVSSSSSSWGTELTSNFGVVEGLYFRLQHAGEFGAYFV